jgi:DNA-binding MarR family transcriptional regulator
MADMVAKGRHDNGATKAQLTPEQRLQLKEDYKSGAYSQAELADRYSVTVRTVGRMLRR